VRDAGEGQNLEWDSTNGREYSNTFVEKNYSSNPGKGR